VATFQSSTTLAQARNQAESILLRNGGELGLLGSSTAYQQVWARDSMICGLGLLLGHGGEAERIYFRSLETLRRYQSPLGRIPHNVGRANVEDPALIAHGGHLQGEDVVIDTIHAGCVDGALWYIVGRYLHFAVTGDRTAVEAAWDSLERALLWLRYQDSNECGLIEVHEAMDWADLFVNRYNVLYDNVLYCAAWRAMAILAESIGRPSDEYRRSAEDVSRKVNAVLWVGPEEPRDWDWIAEERREWLYTLRRIETELVERPFYLPYVAFRDYADRLDTLGNLLAIVMGVADGDKSARILDYIAGCGLDRPWPVRALYPPINPGERDWRDYYRVRNLNIPHHYHNGGAWPFIGGFYVAALVKAGRIDEAHAQLENLTRMVRVGRQREWGFNEWFHGLSGEPMGYDGQSWSAALYLFAYESVQREVVPIFGEAAWTGS
jgi:glycogen debranching enzyme